MTHQEGIDRAHLLEWGGLEDLGEEDWEPESPPAPQPAPTPEAFGLEDEDWEPVPTPPAAPAPSTPAKNRPPRVPLERANNARRAGNAERGRALLAVADGESTIWDVIVAGAATPRSPLLAIKLFQLLTARPDINRPKAERMLDHVATLTGKPWKDAAQRRRVTVRWLIDPRAGGARYDALVDAVLVVNRVLAPAPAPGFPYSPVAARREHEHERNTR